jgi:hypothetical protein
LRSEVPGAIPESTHDGHTEPMELDDGIGWHAWERTATEPNLRTVSEEAPDEEL